MTSVKLYLDEDVDPLLAKVLRNRGHDVITTQEANMLSSSDDAQFKFAISQDRAFFTHNVDGFVKSPTSVLRCILRHCSVRKVRLVPQDLRALNLELFALPSKSHFLRDHQC